MENKKTCKDCISMKVTIPIKFSRYKKGKFLFRQAKAKCKNPSGILYTKNKTFNIGLMAENYDYVEWKVYGNLCKKYEE